MSAPRDFARRAGIVGRRELKALFDHPTAYVLLVVFVATTAFLFFRQAYLVGVASLRPMMELLPWVLLFFVPAVTMRSVAEDTRSGLLEVVLAQPLGEVDWLAGKYIGAVAFLWIGLACTIPIPLALTFGAKMLWGPVVAQFAGAALLIAALAGVGVWASSISRSQVTAFILAVSIMFVLILVGLDPLLVGLPPTMSDVAARIGVLSHFESTERGVIDLRDVVYFLALGGMFLTLAYGTLGRRRLSPTGAAARRLRVGVGIVIATLVVVIVGASYINLRLDLTPNQAFTLSRATKQIAGNLDDIVTIKVFASDELPRTASLLKRELDDMLRDLRSASRGKIRIARRNPATDETARRDAQALGIGPVQFNVVGQAELQVKQGYLGLALQYGGATEAIPFVGRTDDLEYQLTSALRSITRPKKPVIGLIADPRNPNADVNVLRQAMAKAYDIRVVSLSDASQPAADISTLIVVGGSDAGLAGGSDRMRDFFRRNGSALILAGGTQVLQQSTVATPQTIAWNAVIKPFGVAVNSNVAYDLASNQPVPGPASAGIRVMRRYPFFVRGGTTGKSIINRDISTVLLPWPSTLDTTHTSAYEITPLVVTTRVAGTITGVAPIEPTRDFPQDHLATQLLAVQVAPRDSNAHGRVVVVGNADFAGDSFAGGVPENVAFVLNAIDWLAQDESLIGIRAKDARPPVIAFTSAAARDAAEYANTIAVPALIAIVGFLRLAARRKRTLEPYSAAQETARRHVTGAAA